MSKVVTIVTYKEIIDEGMDMEEEEMSEPNESSDMDRLRKLSGM